MNDVQFQLAGPATLAGVANGDHHFPAEFLAAHVPLFYGKAMLLVRPAEGPGGAIRVTATSKGLRPAEAALRAR